MRRAHLLAAALLLAAPRVAQAADLTEVASSFDEHNRFDFRFRIRYDHEEKRAQIKREEELPGQDTLRVFKDLAYESHRDSVTLRAEIGLYHDLMLHAELPIIIEQTQSYSFDQLAGAGCVFPPAANPNCVNGTNSSTVNDGLVPAGGYDAQNRGVGLAYPGVFRGVLRGARGGSGADAFDTINLGLTWAPLSQRRDPTKPTWTWRVEGQFSIGTVMAFDRAAPERNHGVSEGVHRLVIETALSRRLRWLEPYWSLWYILPIAKSDSLFQDYGRNQSLKSPQMQGGSKLGVQFIAIDRPVKQYQLALDLRGRIQAHFGGRGYSEAWELLAGAAPLACDSAQSAYNPTCPQPAQSALGRNPAYTGLTTIENYATLGADIALQGQIGPYFRVRSGFEFTHDQSHLITGEDIGVPQNGNRVTQASEFNPYYRPTIDQIGRRYRVDNVNVYDFYLWVQAMF